MHRTKRRRQTQNGSWGIRPRVEAYVPAVKRMLFAVACVLAGCGDEPTSNAPSASLAQEMPSTPAAQTTASASDAPEAPSATVPSAGPSPTPPAPPRALTIASGAVPVAHRDRLVRASAAFGKTTVRETDGPPRSDILLSPDGPPALVELKNAAVAVALDVLAGLGPLARTARPEDLRATLESAFTSAGVVGSEQGRVCLFHAARIDGQPDLLAAGLGIAGSVAVDDVGMVVSLAGATPTLVLALRRDGYASITDARFASTFAVSPPTADGRWFVVDAFSHPWITSSWRGITYEVFDFASAASKPKRRLHVDDSAYLGDEVIADVSARTDGFTVAYRSWETLYGGVTRGYVRTYRRDGERFVRVAPWVASPADLAQEWLEADRATASAMVAPGARTAADALWDAVHGTKFDGYGAVLVDGASAPLPEPETTTHVTVEFHPPLRTKTPSGSAFPDVLVIDARVEGADGWIIGGISTR